MAAKSCAVTVGELKKILLLSQIKPLEGSLNLTSEQWDHLKSLTDPNFAAL
jgi:hypothetical protein